MKKPAAKRRPTASSRKAGGGSEVKVHPVVIYPFRSPADYGDLEALYEFVGKLAGDPGRYARPITVVDRKTHQAAEGSRAYRRFRAGTVARCSEILDAWCVDTCQMWYSGLGRAFEEGGPGDVYWLIPGDFNYGAGVGREVLGRLHDLPEIVVELGQDLCVGEIATADHNDPKQLIDTYGTFALLYNWFPAEAVGIRQVTERPRSEFVAVRHEFLRELLQQRWYAYEQTVVMLLIAMFYRRRISRFFVGHVTDLPEGHEPLAAALQQVERTERVLKSLWRERHLHKAGWMDRYRALEVQSEQIVRTAMIILQAALG